MPQSPISIIFPTHNGAAELRQCLGALGASSHPPHEILVVDDASSDNLADPPPDSATG